MMGNYHVRCGAGEKPEVATPEAYLSLFGKIPEFPQKISTCRKYNISTTIVLQSIAQIKMLYKDDYETIIGNCDTAICLGTNEQTTADYFSKKLGKATITSRSKSMQVGKQGGSMSFQQTGRELMTPDEIMTMPYDECIVMMNHISPFYDKKYPLEKHPQFMKTGDGNEANFYSLDQDAEFLCVDNTHDFSSAAIEDAFPTDDEDVFLPKSLEEVLDGILLNNPETDGYYLIKDPEESQEKKLFLAYLEQAVEAVEKSVAEEYKTAFFDGEYMDPALMRPIVTKVLNIFKGKIQDVLILCNDTVPGQQRGCLGTLDPFCNILDAVARLGLEMTGEDSGLMIREIKLTDVKAAQLKEACIKGAAVIVKNQYTGEENNEDDDFEGYEDY